MSVTAPSDGYNENNRTIAGSMATVTELKRALREALDSTGKLGELRAQIRSEVFRALDDSNETRPKLSHENLLINELIMEYLQFNKYTHTASVLTTESGLLEGSLGREFLVEELNVAEEPSARSVPLLYSLLSHFLSREDREKFVMRNCTDIQH